MGIDISDNLRQFFFRYAKERRLTLYQVLIQELVSIEQQVASIENDDIQSLKHRFNGVCRYLSFELDSQVKVINTAAQLRHLVIKIHSQVLAIKDEL